MSEREELIDQRRAEERAHERTRLDLAAAIARAERAEGLCAEAMYALGQQGRPADLMPMAVRAVVSRADAAEVRAERAEAQLAALREAAADVRVAFYDLSVPHRIAVERHAVLDAALADTAAAAEAYRERIVEEATAPLRAEIDALDDLIPSSSSDEDPSVAQRTLVQRAEALCMDVTAAHRDLAIVTAERDTLAAALAEVRDAYREFAVATAKNGGTTTAKIRGQLSHAIHRIIAALPADLAVERFRRERAEALETAADAIERGSVLSQYGAHGWLRARAADERGGR